MGALFYMAINDVYQVTLNQLHTPTNERVTTVWFFNQVEILGGAAALFTAFTASGGIMDLMNDLQSTQIANESCKVSNLFSLTDFYEGALAGSGIYETEMLPLFCALNFSLKVDTRGVRPGSKRVPGIPNSAETDGLITLSTYVTAINALKAAMVADVGGGGTGVFDPIVVKRIYEPATEDKKAYYRLPQGAEELNFGHITAALVNMQVSHQVSRGNGR